MDPLSLTANILAVVGAAEKTAEGFRRILSLRHAPQEVLQYVNEISDFRAVITMAQETLRQVEDDESRQALHSFSARMNEKLVKAVETLSELNDIIHSRIIINQSTTSTAGVKINRKEWVRRHTQLKRLFSSLRDTRSDINVALNMITAHGVPEVRSSLRGIVMESQNLSTSMQHLERRTETQLSEIHPRLQAIHSTLQETRSLIATNFENNNRSIGPTFQIQTSVYGESKCDRLCMCQCHQHLAFKSPGWARELVGTLLFGYHRSPFWYRRSCNEKLCRREETCLLNVAYFFPPWFLCRMIFMKDRWTPTHGHVMNIKTPRVVGKNNLPVFLCAGDGNVEGLKSLFSQGIASPFDVDCDFGDSPLTLAVAHRRLDVCELLLNEHADPETPGVFGTSSKTPLDYVWDIILTSPMSPVSLGFKRIFGRFLDLEDNLQQRNFTTLHKIVLGLTPIPLLAQLQISTSDINKPCSQGTTALYWAIKRDDSNAVQTLVNFGADIRVVDHGIRFPALHMAARHSAIKSLEILLKAMPKNSDPLSRSREPGSCARMESCVKFMIESRDFSGWTPLHRASMHDFTGQAVALLLDYSADINSQHSEANLNPSSPLGFAVQWNNYAAAKILLERGADVNFKDPEKQGILHVAAICGDTRMLNILLSADIRVKSSRDEDVFGHTPLQSFDIDRQIYTTEDADTRAHCRELFLILLSRQDPEPTTEEDPTITENPDVAATVEEPDVFYDFDEPIETA